MPVKLTEAQREERDKKKAEKEARRIAHLKKLELDPPEEELIPRARARVYEMGRLAEKFFEEGDPEYDLYERSKKLCNKMRTAYKNLEKARLSQAVAITVGNPVLVEEETQKMRKHFKDFIYYQYAVADTYREFVTEASYED